jgi:hypothetical protein
MMKTKSRTLAPVLNEISWSHAGVAWRATAWPEVAIERRCGDVWLPGQPSDGVFAAAAADVRDVTWRRYLEYVPARERAFVAQFRFSRLEALQVAARCPELLDTLEQVPALTVFISAHVALRGTERPGWDEIAAVFERTGVFGVLEWLGLPASPRALAALRNLADAEIPRRFLAPLRTVLWDGPTLESLERSSVVTDIELARHCHRLAA